MATWETILAADSDRWACDTYRANFPGVDVRHALVGDLIESLPDADVLLGGPPCQPFSVSGKGVGSNDARDCIPEFCAAVEKVRPRMFLMENVPGLLSGKHIRHLGRHIQRLEREGYEIQHRELDSVNFGVPQFRNRLWVWGISKTAIYADGIWFRWPRPTHAWPPPDACMYGGALEPGVTVRQALGLTEWFDAQNDAIHSADEPIGTIQAQAQSKGGQAGHYAIFRHRGASVVRRQHPVDEPCPTVNAFGKGGGDGLFIVGTPPFGDGWKRIRGDIWGRRLLPSECLRLQSAPDDFVFPDAVGKTHRWRIAGNGWASRMGQVFGEVFKLVDPRLRTVIDLFCGGGLGAIGWHGRAWQFRQERQCV